MQCKCVALVCLVFYLACLIYFLRSAFYASNCASCNMVRIYNSSPIFNTSSKKETRNNFCMRALADFQLRAPPVWDWRIAAPTSRQISAPPACCPYDRYCLLCLPMRILTWSALLCAQGARGHRLRVLHLMSPKGALHTIWIGAAAVSLRDCTRDCCLLPPPFAPLAAQGTRESLWQFFPGSQIRSSGHIWQKNDTCLWGGILCKVVYICKWRCDTCKNKN